VQAFTSADRDVIVGSDTYLAATGLDVSNLVVQAGLAVDNMELTVFPDEVSYPQADIIAGRWDNAKFWLFECDYTRRRSPVAATTSAKRPGGHQPAEARHDRRGRHHSLDAQVRVPRAEAGAATVGRSGDEQDVPLPARRRELQDRPE
jgi:hypothetical protein